MLQAEIILFIAGIFSAINKIAHASFLDTTWPPPLYCSFMKGILDFIYIQ